MNRRMILYLICQILRIEAVTMIPAAVIAIVQKEYPSLMDLFSLCWPWAASACFRRPFG
ncbi:MAG: hypothetical protein ACLVJZ_05030 [[Clostridium] leptum]